MKKSVHIVDKKKTSLSRVTKVEFRAGLERREKKGRKGTGALFLSSWDSKSKFYFII